MEHWNFAEVMQYIAYGGFVIVNLSALIRWGIRRAKFLQRNVVGEDGKLYDFFLLRNYVSVNFISPLDRKVWWFVFGACLCSIVCSWAYLFTLPGFVLALMIAVAAGYCWMRMMMFLAQLISDIIYVLRCIVLVVKLTFL